jgi:outer membrane protein assembly factor BamB
MLVVLAACASPQKRVPIVPAPASPVATFRWSLEPMECGDQARRSTTDLCRVIGPDDYVVAVYAPISDEDSRVAVIRYDGDTVGGPLRWEQRLDLGAAPHSAVVTVGNETTIVAAISGGACNVVAIDTASGRVVKQATLVSDGARAVQVEGDGDSARIHVRTRDGGVVAVMTPRTGQVTARRAIADRAIVDREIVEVTPTAEELADIWLGWEHDHLLIRRGTAWKRDLRIVDDEAETALHHASLVFAGDRALVTVHDPEDAKIEVLALDRASGKLLWHTRLTGMHRLVDQGFVRVELDDDQLLVYTTGDRFTCSVGIADGVERACVDHPGPRTVLDFPDGQIVIP